MTSKINSNRVKYSLDDFPNLMELKEIYKTTSIPLDLLKDACEKDGLKCGNRYPILSFPSFMKRKEKKVVESIKKTIKNYEEVEKEMNEEIEEEEVENDGEVEKEMNEEIEEEELENDGEVENDDGYDIDEFKDEDSDIE